MENGQPENGQPKKRLKIDRSKLSADIVNAAGNNPKQPNHRLIDMSSEAHDLGRMTDKDIDSAIARQTSSLQRLEGEKERRKLMRFEQDLGRMTDKEIDCAIARQTSSLQNFGSRLPDKGQKFLFVIKRLEGEKKRRKLMWFEQDLGRMTDKEIDSDIVRLTGYLQDFGSRLPDKGQKFWFVIKRLEGEKERRKLMWFEQDLGGMTDKEIDRAITRQTGSLQNIGPKLSDKGQKFRFVGLREKRKGES